MQYFTFKYIIIYTIILYTIIEKIKRGFHGLKKIKIAICGLNGHQIHEAVLNHELAEIVGFYDCDALTDEKYADFKRYDTFSDVLTDNNVDFVSLCSSKRSEQAKMSIMAMEAGKDVYAEKPCAMNLEDLEKIINAAKSTNKKFREMSNSIAEGLPFLLVKETVESSVLGDIVQIYAQKSYPNHEGRPQDEDVDGGQLLQNGTYTIRMAEQVVGLKVVDILAYETVYGNPVQDGGLVMAVSFVGRLENGGIFSGVSNYLNQRTFGIWGNETLCVFGVDGFCEITDGGQRSRLVTKEKDHGEIVLQGKERSYLDDYLSFILGTGSMARTMEDELHATKMAIIARDKAIRS